MVHPGEQEVIQEWQEAFMDEQGAPDKTYMEKGSILEVAAGSVNLEKYRDTAHCAGMRLGKSKPTFGADSGKGHNEQ